MSSGAENSTNIASRGTINSTNCICWTLLGWNVTDWLYIIIYLRFMSFYFVIGLTVERYERFKLNKALSLDWLDNVTKESIKFVSRLLQVPPSLDEQLVIKCEKLDKWLLYSTNAQSMPNNTLFRHHIVS